MEQYIEVNPTDIKVKDGLPRLRTEMGSIKDLIASIEKFGQLQPIVCNREMELIAGGRRLLACLEAKKKVRVVFSDTIDPLQMREMELEENLQRKSLTPAEEVLAVSEIHTLKQKMYGETTQGKEGGWTEEDTANIVGKSRTAIIGDLALAEAVKDFPILSNCKTKSDIRRAVKGLQKISQSVKALEAYEQDTKGAKYELYNADGYTHMKSMADASVDVLLTDPPYGIDIHALAIGLGGHSGSEVTTTGTTYDDEFAAAMALIGNIATESFRVVKPTGFAMVFCAISHFWVVKTMFESAGWNVSQRPIIWIKNESGQNNAPSKWMSAGYESLLFARRIDSRLVVEGKVDWIQCPLVPPPQRTHQAEKPVALLKELLTRVALPSCTILDPCIGSGATIEAALEMKMYGIGCELSKETYALATQRLKNYEKKG